MTLPATTSLPPDTSDVTEKRRVLWVGAFPGPESTIIGGFVTSCRLLRASSFGDRVALSLIDGTQPNNPAPPALRRATMALGRLALYVIRFERFRPHAVLLFASSTQASVAEKGLMAWYARSRGAAALMFPRGGAVLDAGEASPRVARWLRKVFAGAHVVLCQGPAWHRFATRTLGFPAGAAPIVPNWTATPGHVAIGRKRTGRPEDSGRVRLLFVGWVNREKGSFELVEACRRLFVELDFSLAIVGDGVAAGEIGELIDRHGLGDRVRMAGWLGGDDLLQAYAAADVFVLPSWAEGLPNAMIEAMAAGLATVVTAVGAIPGLVADGRQALLVPPRDVDALTDALRHVISDGQLRRRLGTDASRWAAEQFGVERAAGQMVAAIEHAIAISRGSTTNTVSAVGGHHSIAGGTNG